MSKEAMKLALEALEETRNALAWFYDSYPQDVTKKGNELLPHVETVLAAIREALAEQPAQQEPVAFYVYKPTLPRGNLGSVSDGDLPWVYDQDPSSGFSARMLVTPITSPPASKPWVGLTEEDKQIAFDDTQEGGGFWEFADAIETKLREKNT